MKNRITILTLIITFFALSTAILANETFKIVHQTDEVRTCFGGEADLQIKYLGDSLQFQWYFDSKKIVDATEAYYYIPFVHYYNSGIYQCEIRRGDEVYYSKPIPVYAVSETKIVEEPCIQSYVEDGDYSFRVKAHANGIGDDYQFDYQWYADGLELENNGKYSGSNSSILNITNVTLDDIAIRYHCVVIGLCGAAETQPKRLIQGQIFGYIDEELDIRFCRDADEITINVKIESPYIDEMKFQWRRAYIGKISDNEIYSGTKTNTLTVKNVDLDEFTYFYLEISLPEFNYKKEFGSYMLQKVFPPEFEIDLPDSWTAFDKDNGQYYGKVKLYVVPKGTYKEQKNIKYQWYRNGELFYEGSQMPFSPNQNVWGGDVNSDKWWFNDFMLGKWQCKMYNECFETWSNVCDVKLGYPDFLICENADTVITVQGVELQEDEIYIWHHEDKFLNKPNLTYKDTTLYVSEIKPEDEGNYYCYIYNKKSMEITSTVAKIYIKINNAPIILKELPEEIEIGENGGYYNLEFVFKYYNQEITYEIYRNDTKIRTETLTKAVTYKFLYVTDLINIFHYNDNPAEYYIRIYDDKCMDWESNKCKIKQNVGVISDVSEKSEISNKVIAYPNPAKDYINLTGVRNMQSAVLMDLNGSIVRNYNFLQNSKNLDIIDIPAGNYILKVIEIDNISSIKIIIMQ